MTYILTVLDRGRPIAKHPKLDYETGRELVSAYHAIGWPEDKIRLDVEVEEDRDSRPAAA